MGCTQSNIPSGKPVLTATSSFDTLSARVEPWHEAKVALDKVYNRMETTLSEQSLDSTSRPRAFSTEQSLLLILLRPSPLGAYVAFSTEQSLLLILPRTSPLGVRRPGSNSHRTMMARAAGRSELSPGGVPTYCIQK